MIPGGINNISVAELIQRKINNANAELTLEEKISLINGCILIGSRETKKYEAELKNAPVVFIGNTGAGKSTLINYLAGCTLQFIDRTRCGMPPGIEDCVIVRGDSEQKEVTKIGHTKASETLIHQIASLNARVFVDCPGFADNRGVELNVANVTNVSNMLRLSERTKIILVQNYSSLLGDKARGLSDAVKTVQGLFGSVARFSENRSSVLLAVTKVPAKGDGEQRELDDLKEIVRAVNDDQLTHEARQILNALARNLFIYHPTDEIANMCFEGGLTRENILQKIDRASGITNADEVFKVPLDARDENGLQNICQEMAGVISNALNQGNHELASQLLQHTYLLRKVEHDSVKKFVQLCRKAVVTHFKEQVQLLTKELAAHPNELTRRASDFLHTISLGVSAFGEEERQGIETEIEFEEIKNRVGAHQQQIRFLAEEGKVRAITNDFLGKCSAFDFDDAEILLEKITEKVNELCENFRNQGVNEKFNLEFLNRQLTTAKEQRRIIEQSENDMAEMKQQLNEKVTQMQTAVEDERKRLEEDKRNLEDQISRRSAEVRDAAAPVNDNGDLLGAIGTIGQFAFTAFFGQWL